MDLMLRLEREAARAGGRVHALVGNHEVMNVSGDLRYTSPAEYASYVTADSGFERDRAYDATADPALKADAGYRDKWYADHPLGWVEHRRAFGPDGVYGRWIRQRNAVVRIDDYLFLHEGLSQQFEQGSVGAINAAVRNELRESAVPKDRLAAGGKARSGSRVRGGRRGPAAPER